MRHTLPPFAVAVLAVWLGVPQVSAGQSVKQSVAPTDDAVVSLLTMASREALASSLQTAPPPEPRHSGFKALAKETAVDFGAFPRRKSTWAILAIGGAAALATHPADDYVNT